MANAPQAEACCVMGICATGTPCEDISIEPERAEGVEFAEMVKEADPDPLCAADGSDIQSGALVTVQLQPVGVVTLTFTVLACVPRERESCRRSIIRACGSWRDVDANRVRG